MASRPPLKSKKRAGRVDTERVAQLWQFPLLLAALGLFGYAAYLFIDPKPGLSINDKIGIAQKFIEQDRAEAAIAQLNRILSGEKLTDDNSGKVHLMLAESIDLGQKQLKIAVPINFQNIIEQTRQATIRKIKLGANDYRRLGESYEALGHPVEALDNYRRAMTLDPDHSLRLLRKVIDLQLAQDDIGPAGLSLDEYLKDPTLADAERGWALGQKSEMLIDAGRFADAKLLLDQALRLSGDKTAEGAVNYRLGYCAYKLGDPAEAERFFRMAREQLSVRHPLDAEAAYHLGKIAQDRNEYAAAMSFYEDIMTSHIDAKVMPLARLGRSVCRIALGKDEPGLQDFATVVREVTEKPSRAKFKDATVVGLQQAAKMLSTRGNVAGALELMTAEQSLVPDPDAAFFARIGFVFEQRADQIERTIPGSSEAETVRKTQLTREMRLRAGDAYVSYSRKLTLADDRGYGEAMWKGIDLYERAGSTPSVISALELFAAERPSDSLAPDALLRLGRTYQVAGLFDKAIDAFRRNQLRYPKSLAASKSGVPLAQAYFAKGPESYGKAEAALLNVVDNNELLTPESEEFKQALFELAQLYYRTGRFEESVVKLEEFVQRYPVDDRQPQLLFLMADSYRKSAGLLPTTATVATVESGGLSPDLAEATAARRDRLSKARGLYDRVVESFRVKTPSRDIEKLYLRLSHFYRADCVYDLGDFNEAIKLYDTAAFRYQDDPSALAAYVQIVNAYCALGKIDQAKTANERAKWLLRKIPPEAFTNGTFSMPKAYWEQWLKWTSEAGMW